MKVTDFLFNEFIYGGHWLSLGAVAISMSIMILLEISIRWEFLPISYLLIQTIYTYNHYKELETDRFSESYRVNHLITYKKLLPYTSAAYGILFFIILSIFGTIESIFFGGFLLGIGLLFSGGGKKISGRIVGLKSIYVSLSWAFSVPFIAIYCYYPINSKLLLLFIFVFLRFLVSTIFFDIKDIKNDKKAGFQTFPLWCKNNIKMLNYLHLINVISFLPIIFGVFANKLPFYSLLLLFLLIYSFHYIQKAKNKEVDILSLSYILVDGEFYYWPLLIFLGLLFFS